LFRSRSRRRAPTGAADAALAKHLRHIQDNAAQWPADVNDATTMVPHHVMMAFYNLDMPGAAAAVGAE
jgi:hypothetical protein